MQCNQVGCDTAIPGDLLTLGVEPLSRSSYNDPIDLQPIHTAIHDVIGMLQRSQSLQEWNFLGTKLISQGKPKKNKAPKRQWVWVMDFELTQENVHLIALGGRARWKIENETFQTLKKQGYNLEHNYGHGYQNLSHVLAGLMFTALLVDQVLLAFNVEMRKALMKTHGRYAYLWKQIRSLFDEWIVDSLETLYLSVF